MLYLGTLKLHSMKKVFLLGGHDLEMLTIRDILMKYGQEFYDRNLTWDTAYLRQYSDILDSFPADSFTIYGIELKEDDVSVPDNYISINHHNEDEEKPASLEQVCSLLGEKMDRQMQLIAANDKSYIPGMEALNATEKEIYEIRLADRMSQGVTMKEEDEAETAIQKAFIKNGILCVRSTSKRFSPIVDRLYKRAARMLIYTDHEFTYYGWGRDLVSSSIQETFPHLTLYWGGGKYGFVGAGPCDTQLIGQIINTVMTMDMVYSEHIFMFPFTCEYSSCKKDVLKAFKKLKFPVGEPWERVLLSAGDDNKPDIYNEKNYFYPFAHDVIYDTGDESHIRHFERIEPKNNDSVVTYNIEIAKDTGSITYSLKVKKMHLNLYSTGVGVLSIFTENRDYPDKQQILEINQYGRRLFPPFRAEVIYHIQTPLSLSINGLDREYRIEYTDDNKEWTPNSPAKFIVDIIGQGSSHIHNIQPIHDDRMFVMSWYKYDEQNWKTAEGYKSMLDDSKGFLYQYIFLDNNGPSCANSIMRQKLLSESVYDRWQEEGTLYGITRYSFVMLTTTSCPDFLLRSFETEYERMAEIVLVQRASILRFSSLIKKALDDKGHGFNKYYQQYISFLNRFRLPEVSAQDQAIELYEILCQKIRIKENAEDLDKQFNELQEFLELKSQRGLNELAAWAVPASVATALFTFFFHDNYDNGTIPCLPEHSGMFWLLATFVVTAIIIIIIRRKNR